MVKATNIWLKTTGKDCMCVDVGATKVSQSTGTLFKYKIYDFCDSWYGITISWWEMRSNWNLHLYNLNQE